MNVPRDRLHLLSFDVAVKEPVVWHSISGAGLTAWLSRNGKSPKEQVLKSRLEAILKS
jgi:hypothetical protein